MSRPENPPAFPRTLSSGMGGRNNGMTLRDWFAGQALVGIGTWMPNVSTAVLQTPDSMRARAEWAYQQADAMLAARAQDPRP